MSLQLRRATNILEPCFVDYFYDGASNGESLMTRHVQFVVEL